MTVDFFFVSFKELGLFVFTIGKCCVFDDARQTVGAVVVDVCGIVVAHALAGVLFTDSAGEAGMGGGFVVLLIFIENNKN